MDRLRVEHLEVVRTARLAVVGPPAATAEELWVLLHGYRQLAARFLDRFAALDDGRRRLVAPEALSRFYVDEDGGPHGPEHRVGASWMTRDDREVEIRDYVRYLDTVALTQGRADAGLRRVVVGFSQGVHTAARWIVSGGSPVPRLTALVGTGLPDDLDARRAANRLAGARVVLVRGRSDRLHPASRLRADHDRLVAWGARVEVVEHDAGHVVPGGALEAIAGLVAAAG